MFPNIYRDMQFLRLAICLTACLLLFLMAKYHIIFFIHMIYFLYLLEFWLYVLFTIVVSVVPNSFKFVFWVYAQGQKDISATIQPSVTLLFVISEDVRFFYSTSYFARKKFYDSIFNNGRQFYVLLDNSSSHDVKTCQIHNQCVNFSCISNQ